MEPSTLNTAAAMATKLGVSLAAAFLLAAVLTLVCFIYKRDILLFYKTKIKPAKKQHGEQTLLGHGNKWLY